MKTKVKKRKNKFAQEETRFRVAEYLKLVNTIEEKNLK